MMRRMRTLWVVLAAAAWLAGAPATAAEVRDSGFLESVDATFGTVVIGGEQYSVGSFTVIANESGRAVPLEELPTLAAGASSDETAVWYEAAEANGPNPRPLLRLHLTGGPPR